MKIEFLKIFTTRLHEQINFYQQVLGLPLSEVTTTSFKVRIGYSVLEICQQKDAKPYHIAFHIPAHQEEKALSWLEERVKILTDEGEKIVDFPAWKAKSMYFYDADRNILEFISRREFFTSASENFSEESICGISEIGLATKNVKEQFDFLNKNFGLSKFSGDYERFCATGDDEGLFIIINRNQKDWIPTGDKAYASPFEIRILVKKASFGASYKNESLELL